jgi:hypothetical protein
MILLILFYSQSILTENINEENIRNINNYNKEIKSIEIEASRLMDDEPSTIDSKNEYLYKINKLDDEEEEGAAHGDSSDIPHSRQKRLLWITDDGRLALPPGTTLIIAPTLGLPMVRYPPDGFHANISITLPLTIDFDKLGLTDNENPLGVLPPIFARSMGRAAGSMLADYIRKYLNRRQKRDLSNEHFKVKSDFDENNEIPHLPDEHKHAFHGGERAILYTIIEDFISNFGVDGKACLLRTICEVHSKSVERYGMIGEMLKLFLTASKSPFSDLLYEYVEAEEMGKGTNGPGECFPYYKDCPKSLFRNSPVTVAHINQEFNKQSSNTGHSM